MLKSYMLEQVWDVFVNIKKDCRDNLKRLLVKRQVLFKDQFKEIFPVIGF